MQIGWVDFGGYCTCHRNCVTVTRMPKMRRKADLPSKLCGACGLPFNWRKKWARDWDSVKYCSDRCRSAKSGQKPVSVAP